MRKIPLLLLAFTLIACAQKTAVVSSTQSQEPTLINFSSDAGIKMFEDAKEKKDFY